MRAVNNNIGPISGNYTSSQKLQNYYIEKSPSYKKEQNNQEYSQVKTKADISSGLVAYLLNQGNNQYLWRQTIGSNYPVLLNGEKVYGYNDGELITNTELFWDEKGFLTYKSKIYNQKPKLEKDIQYR
ncbi:MAG: hypothetical protein MJ211_15185 [Bacteroidales bacterium]|nr:hypothetical protein [Bacteroidales bacterium]